MDYLYIKIFDFTLVVYNLKQFANISTYGLLFHTILAMESKLYMCLRCETSVKSTSSLTRHIIACKLPIFLLYCQLSNPNLVLDYNITNSLNLSLDKNKEDITPEVSNHGDFKKIRLVNIGNDEKNIRLEDIDKQKPATPNMTP